jgi:hypothetical protein
MSMVIGNMRTSEWVASLSTSSAVTLPQSEEIKIRSCAIVGPINPSVMTNALNNTFGIRHLSLCFGSAISSEFTHLLCFRNRGAEKEG